MLCMLVRMHAAVTSCGFGIVAVGRICASHHNANIPALHNNHTQHSASATTFGLVQAVAEIFMSGST